MPLAHLFILLLLALAVHGQEQKRLAILKTVDDGEPSVESTDLNHLTVKLQEIAGNVLQNRYGIMTEQSIVDKLGKDNAAKACKEAAGCLAQLGRKINADYIGQARLGRFGGNLTIRAELYNSATGLQVGTISSEGKDLLDLLVVLETKAPALFRKMPGVSGGPVASPFVASGISGLQKPTGYESDYEKRYLAYLSTEPSGAVLSFDGIPAATCVKTPCKAELREGGVRVIAALERYETADTMVWVSRNNQNISIILKPNFGVLEINPIYLDGIGKNRLWKLSINDNPYSLGEIKLSPNKYAVKLIHECYESISFGAGINKGEHVVFDMSKYITLKKGGLVLSAEREGEPISEPVFVNGERVGETPFSGSVPLCSEVEIGYGKEKVDVEIKHKQTVSYTHRILNYTPKYEPPPEEISAEGGYRMPSLWSQSWGLGFGLLAKMNSINNLYSPMGGGILFLNLEFYKLSASFLRFGFNFDFGLLNANKMEKTIKQKYPEVDSIDVAMIVKGGAFMKLYPADFIYLMGGANFGSYGGIRGISTATNEEVAKYPNTRTVTFPIGVGLFFGSEDVGFILDTQYNIALLKNRVGGYWSFNVGIKFGQN